MSDSPTYDPTDPTTELLARLSWTRRLAARLVGDERADDVAQDAWLAAVRRTDADWPPSEGWLAGTVRRLAARTWRSAGRRADRETRAVEGGEPQAATDDVVSRGEELRRLADLVLDLDEPFRTTLLLRFQEELSVPEIAQRLAVPPDTVRWRLRTGLTRLREELERRDGREWRAALAPLVPTIALLVERAPETTAIAALTGTGGMIVSTKWISTVVTAVALLLGVVIRKSSDAEPAPSIALLEDDTALVTPKPNSVQDDSTRSSEPTLAGPLERRVVAAGPKPEESLDGAAVITGRVLGPQDQALREVRVWFTYPDGLPETRTDADGRFRLIVRDTSAERARLVVEPDPFHSLHQVWFRPDRVYDNDRLPLAAGPVDLGDIHLVAGGVVEGRVTDEAGEAIAKPWMILGKRDGYAYPHAGGEEWGDEDGRYRIEHIHPGLWTIDAQHHGHRIVELPIEIRAGEVVRVDHVLPESPTISGVVVDQDGEALEGVAVSGGYGYMYSQGLKTDADGAFTLQLAVEEAARMSFRREGYDCDSDPNALVAPGTDDLVVHMTALPRLRFRVIDADSREEIEEFGLRVLLHGGPAGDWTRSRHSSRDPHVARHDDGIVEGFARPGIDAVKVVVPGYGSHSFDVRVDADDADTMTIALSSGLEVRGRVLRSGVPVEGARVGLARGAHIAFEEVTVNGVTAPQDVSPAMDVLRSGDGYAIGRVIALDSSPPLVGYSRLFAADPEWATTGPDGRFVFRNTSVEGRYRMEIGSGSVADASPLVIAKLVLEPTSVGVADLGDLALPDATSLTGRLELDEPGSLAGHRVRLADFNATMVVTDDEGSFRFENIAPGEHTLELDPSDEIVAEKATYFVRVTEASRRDVVLPVENEASCAVRVVLTKNGVPLEGSDVRLRPVGVEERSGSHRVGRRTDEDGVVEGVVPRIGECTAHLFIDGVSFPAPGRFRVEGTTTEISIDLVVGRLAIAPPQGRAWPKAGVVQVTVTPHGDVHRATHHHLQLASGVPYDPRGTSASDDAGRAVLSFVPPGDGHLSVEIESEDDSWSGEATYHAIANETVEVYL